MKGQKQYVKALVLYEITDIEKLYEASIAELHRMTEEEPSYTLASYDSDERRKIYEIIEDELHDEISGEICPAKCVLFHSFSNERSLAGVHLEYMSTRLFSRPRAKNLPMTPASFIFWILN